MRTTLRIVAPVALALLALPVLAGGAECEKAKAAAQTAENKGGCKYSKEECMKMMETARHSGWLGIEYDKNESGAMQVTKVLAASPAEKAGFKTGDILVALNGVEINEANHEKLYAVKKNLAPGATATWTVKRDGYPKDLAVTLGKMPDDVYQAMVTEHMKEHVAVAAR